MTSVGYRVGQVAATILLGICLVVSPLSGQVESRQAETEAAREKKAAHVEPETVSRTESLLLEIKEKKLLERITAGFGGFNLAFGGQPSGSGFSLGIQYLRDEIADGNVVFRGSVRGSLKRYYLMDLGLDMPKLAGGKLFTTLYAAHSSAPRMPYYGPGPDSRKDARSNYLLELTTYDATLGVRPVRPFSLSGTFSYLQTNVGPGRDPRYVSSDIVFGPLATPGIDQQADFLRGRAVAQFDYRDNPGGPRRGGNYLVQYSILDDRKLNLHSFRLLDVELQQYIPFFNERRVIALRGKTSMAFVNDDQRVPFYLQPTLGGSDDLRGFRPFRFYDDNLLVMNAEYRWETFSGLDMAIFCDAGKVFPRRSDLNFRNLEASVGFGFRANIRNSVFMRVDTGFSHEGFQVWIKFSNVF